MTGKEKIQAVIDAINEAYKALITGNVVELYSGTLDNKGLRLDEQKQVLDILANDKKCIKYVSKRIYETEADIDPQTRVDIMEVASMVAEPEYLLIEQLLASLTYTIEVLDSFEAKDASSIAVETKKDSTTLSNNPEKYRLTYSSARELRFNGKRIAKPDFMSENDQFLNFIFKDGNAGRRIEIKELLGYMRVDKLKKTPHQILDGLNIKGNLRA